MGNDFAEMTSTNEMLEMVWKIRKAMQTGWNEVVNLYESDPIAHETKVNRSGYTALHVAVADGQEDIVEKLVNLIIKTKQNNELEAKSSSTSTTTRAAPEIKNKNGNIVPLRIGNQKGNTPLHLAASIGNLRMCQTIAAVDSRFLLEIKNDAGETPLFLAALHGKKDVFLYLNSILPKHPTTFEATRSFRRDNGDTILHCAINGEYLDLAFLIITLHEELANSFNKDGKTPLHTLASKPSAFKSASNFGKWKTIVYKCIFVEKLKKKCHDGQTSSRSLKDGGDNNHKIYPENYTALVRFFDVLWELAMVGM
ncbi:Transmembrane protein [Parasponia andersonii]|uniref:Transmembrane protein n=1 Tax=Parasponia andersonii TaxID=3476 RepID=A0A2P5CW14_PARAD|nr:Transmembrane protein [Parasponia andersonii]